MRAASRRRPEAVALAFEGRRWTWADYDAEVGGAAQALAALGLRAGARLAVRSPNRPELAFLFFAAARLGAAVVPLNARLADPELAPLLAQAAASFSFGALPGAAPWPSGRAQGEATVEDEAVAAGLFTSGTTGVPRLVELTHANFRASAAASAANLGATADDRWLGTLPLFHVGGLAMLYRCAIDGCALWLEPQFDAARAVAAFDAGATHASLVPTTLERVLEQRGARPFQGVKAVLIGGGPMGAALLKRARALALPVLQTYGLTEACSQVATERPAEADGESAGHPLPGLELQIVDEAGRPVAPGAEGEIAVRGPTVAWGQGAWLRTRDLGRLDARGRLSVLARRSDLIISGGENVYPAEVEAVLRGFPGVLDVAVVGREDATWGQVPVAVVVGDVALEALRDWAQSQLAGFKVPRAWVRREALPRNATGKLERHRITLDH